MVNSYSLFGQFVKILTNEVPSQLVLKSTCSHFGPFVLIDVVISYSLFGQFVLVLINSPSFWSTRTHIFGHFVVILGPFFWGCMRR